LLLAILLREYKINTNLFIKYNTNRVKNMKLEEEKIQTTPVCYFVNYAVKLRKAI